jgi:hypothetical protein
MLKLILPKIAVLSALTFAPVLLGQDQEDHIKIIRKDGPEQMENVCPECGAVRGGKRVFLYKKEGPRKRPLLREESRVFRFEGPAGHERDVIIRRHPAPPVPPHGPEGFAGGGAFGGRFSGPADRLEIRRFEGGGPNEHLEEAIRHLREGGFPEMADKLETQAAKHRAQMEKREHGEGGKGEAYEQLQRERESLQEELKKLRRELEEVRSLEKHKEEEKEEKR